MPPHLSPSFFPLFLQFGFFSDGLGTLNLLPGKKHSRFLWDTPVPVGAGAGAGAVAPGRVRCRASAVATATLGLATSKGA